MDRLKISLCIAALVLVSGSSTAQIAATPGLPVAPTLFVHDSFGGCEGIAFNGEGRLFVTCDRTLWEVGVSADVRRVAELDSNLGLAGIGPRDVLVADFGPSNAFRNGRNSDGVVWRISPEGSKKADAVGIGDPNFILVRSDGSYLVSDDATSDIYNVTTDGDVALFTTAVNHPNGLAMSFDESILYVAQIFTNIRPVVADNAVWEIRLKDGAPFKDAKLTVRAGPGAAVDGLAMDAQGRIYIAANNAGELWRYDPTDSAMTLIATGMFGIASLAFGEGLFDHESIYATTTFSQGRGGKVWRIPAGVTGAKLNR